MAANINEIDGKVVPRINDNDFRLGGSAAPGSSAARLEAIGSARAEYEAAYPREVVIEITGNGGFDYQITGGPWSAYVDGNSSITQIRYPVVAGDPAPPLVDDEDWVVVRTPGGLFLRFLNGIRPAATQKFWVYFTAQHTLSGGASTVPAAHDDALADLAASFACLMLSAYYEQTGDSTMQADAVDRPRRTDTYRALAKQYREAYKEKLGMNEPARAGFAVADLNPPASAPQVGGLLFHERR
jgi:hypothetical protein